MQAELPTVSGNWIYLLQNCRQSKNLAQTKVLHSFLCEQHLDSNPVLVNYLVPALAHCGSLWDACHVFDRLPLHYQSEYSWNALISGCTEHGVPHHAFQLYDRMLQAGHPVQPGRVTFLALLNACTRLKDSERAWDLHREIIKRGLERALYSGSPVVGNRLVDVYAKCGLLAEAHKVLYDLPARNAVSWNVLIAGYVDHGLTDEVGKFLQQMLLDGVPPDSSTFASSLKACGISGALKTGQEIYAQTTKRGSEKELYVGSTLVYMYMECGSLAEARLVFDSLPVRDAITWAALIAGYADQGSNEEVECCFRQMLHEGISPDYVTFVCSLKACAAAGSLTTAREFHAEIIKRGFESELYVGSTLVDVYSECSLHAEACQVFEGLKVRDAVSWNALIAGYAECGLDKEAWNSFQQMLLHGISPDPVTFVSSLIACSSSQALETGYALHMETVKRGLETELQVGRALVNFYIECGILVEARHVFEGQLSRSTDLWAALIAGHVEHGLFEEASNYFQRMLLKGVSPDPVMLVRILKACSTTQALETARVLHIEATRRGVEMEIHVSSTLVDMYAMCRCLVEACQVFDGLPVRNAVAWNALMTGYADYGLGEKVVICYQQMLLEGESPDSITLLCTLKACGTIGLLEVGKQIHAETLKKGFERELHVGNMLVDMYSKCGSLLDARQVFKWLKNPDEVSWAALISGYTECGLPEEATSCFQQMQLESICPDSTIYVCSLKACGAIGALETGQEIHTEITKKGSEREGHVGSTLVDTYGNCGLLAEARQVFENLPVRSIVSWTAMINAFGNNNEGKMAIQYFKDMEAQGGKPTSITLMCLLAACSHSSLVLKGQEYFKSMTERYGIKPTIDHYGCMVDLLARSGHVHEAERVVAGMQCPPSSIILYALFTACKNYGKVELGQRCFHQLVEMNLEDSSAYLLMADIYASVGRWSDAHSVEEMRKSAGSKKKPGSALIEVNKRLHEFVVGVNQSKGIFELSETLSSRMKDEEHVPNLESVLGRSFYAEESGFCHDFVYITSPISKPQTRPIEVYLA